MAENTKMLLKGIILSTILINLMNLLNNADASVFSYIPDMENLLAVQGQVIRSAKVHQKNLDESDQRIIQGYICRWESEHRKAMTNTTHYLENPINAYGLVRRLIIDLKAVENILTWDRFREYKRKKTLVYPSELKLRAANVALIHLVLVYQLNITELANGTLKSNFNKGNTPFVEYVSPMVADDCFELAQAAAKYYEYDIAFAFAEEAFNKYSQDCAFGCPFRELDIMMFLSNLYADIGDLAKSLQWLAKNKTEELTPSESVQYESVVRNLKEKLKTQEIIQNPAIEMVKANQMMNNKPLRVKWKDLSYSLCFAECINRNYLTCYYKAGPSPFLRLARLKAETLHNTPEITLFHDVISEQENSAIREMSVEQFENTDTDFENFLNPDNMFLRTSNCQGGMQVLQLMRQVACFEEFEDGWPAPVLHRRAIDISGMDPTLIIDTLVVVVNYGVGGYHNPHYDSEYDGDTPIPTVGTILYYLDEVDQGGATAFTELNLTIFPQKNSALYWRNLLPSGSSNLMTKHAACPVLRGSKWSYIKQKKDTRQCEFKSS